MNVNSTSSTEKIKETNNQTQVKQNENEEQISFSEEYQQLLAQNEAQGFPNALYAESSADSEYLSYANGMGLLNKSFNYNTMTISKEDAMFFSDLVEKTDFVVNESADKTSFQLTLTKAVAESDTQSMKSAEVSKSLMNLIEEAYKTQRPTRIDFDNNVSVILRISKDGKVSAEFIPGDKAVEQYLRDNIGFLKSTLEEKDIAYGDIMYKPYKNNSKQGRNRNNGGNN